MTMVLDYGIFRKMESISISRFKATCLAVLQRVHSTGQPVLVTRRGEPIAEVVPPSRPTQDVRQLGVLAKRGRIVGDILSPVIDEIEWEVLSD
jgi:prevent-host-death family protein